MKSLLGAALLLAGLAYPFWVYAMMERAQPGWIMLPMAALWLLRTLVPGKSQPGGRLPPLLALIGCIVFALVGSRAGLASHAHSKSDQSKDRLLYLTSDK